MANSDPFSLSTMLNALPKLHIPTASEAMREDTLMITPPPPPPGFTPPREPIFSQQNQPQDLEELRLQWMFVMTDSQQFAADLLEEFVSNLPLIELKWIASFLTLDSDYFMEIATNEYGSIRLQKLLGVSDDVADVLCAAILRRFLHVMTDQHASKVAVRAMRLWGGEKKQVMLEYTLFYAVNIACDQHGCITLSEIITNLDCFYRRDQLVHKVAENALWLSTHAYGNFVVQHMLKLNHIKFHAIIAFRFRGHCVELSFQKHGSEVMKRLLEEKESVVQVVMELIHECDGDRLVRLARSEYGNSVVCKALRVMHEMGMPQLTPVLDLLRMSGVSNIAAILNSV